MTEAGAGLVKARRAVALTLPVFGVSYALLLFNTGVFLQGVQFDPRRMLPSQRYWEDIDLALGLAASGYFPVALEPRPLALIQRAAEAGPWSFLEVLPLPAEIGHVTESPRFDDAGRPIALGLLFRSLGGASAFLPFWLGVLLVGPIMFAILHGLVAGGRLSMAWWFGILTGGSCYLAEVLALSYSTAGFYSVSVLLLLSVSMAARAARGGRRIMALATVSGAVLGLCTCLRSSSIFLAPGFLIALLRAVWVATADSADSGAGHGLRKRARLGVAVLLLFVAPVAALRWAMSSIPTGPTAPIRPPQFHSVWFGLWGGLGDFDRRKGHTWRDAAVSAAARRLGGRGMWEERGFLRYSPEDEHLLRAEVLGHIREDPLWYMDILARRTWATLTQWKLRPWLPIHGRTVAVAQHPNEGVLDSYYYLTKRIDFFGVGRLRAEVPVELLVLPSWVVGAVVFYRKQWSSGAGTIVGTMATSATGALAFPVLITTAGALETQAFGLIYLFGTAFVLGLLTERIGAVWRAGGH